MRKLLLRLSAPFAATLLLFGAQGAATAAAPRLTVAQAEAIQAQTPPKIMGGKDAVKAKVAMPVVNRAPIMKPKGMPAKALGGVKPLVGCAPSCYGYSVGKQSVNVQGTAAAAGVFAPTMGVKGNHTLMELALETADEKSIIEVGWTVDQVGVNGTDHTNPHLFIYSWRAGIGMGYNSGNGWTDYASRVNTVGDSLASYMGTTEKNFFLQYNPPVAPATTGRWWAGFGSGWLGSWPESAWTTGTGAIASFSQANFVQHFFEVNDQVDDTCSQMGNGLLGSSASTGATPPGTGPARISNSVYFVVSGTAPTVALSYGSTRATQNAGNISGTTKTFAGGGPRKAAGTGLC